MRSLGVGLVSGDGWRVPYSGSDCAVYHEGIGHPVGLPHPEPLDDSVMGTAQYKYWINQTWVNRSQKQALGWDDAGGEGIANRAKEANKRPVHGLHRPTDSHHSEAERAGETEIHLAREVETPRNQNSRADRPIRAVANRAGAVLPWIAPRVAAARLVRPPDTRKLPR